MKKLNDILDNYQAFGLRFDLFKIFAPSPTALITMTPFWLHISVLWILAE